jgi:hypothetical protein
LLAWRHAAREIADRDDIEIHVATNVNPENKLSRSEKDDLKHGETSFFLLAKPPVCRIGDG